MTGRLRGVALALTVAIAVAVQCAGMCLAMPATPAHHSDAGDGHGHGTTPEPCAPEEHGQPEGSGCCDHAAYVFTAERASLDLSPVLVAPYTVLPALAVPASPDLLALPPAWSGSPPGSPSVIALTTVLRI